MPYYYQRACACFPDRDVYLVSTSRGPRGGDALLMRSSDEGRSWKRVEGLPETIDNNINTFQIIPMAGGHGWVIVENEQLYQTSDYGETWQRVDHDFPRLYTAIRVGTQTR
jgi:photosystem II stability/assembly factor-like uncharacterized protein